MCKFEKRLNIVQREHCEGAKWPSGGGGGGLGGAYLPSEVQVKYGIRLLKTSFITLIHVCALITSEFDILLNREERFSSTYSASDKFLS